MAVLAYLFVVMVFLGAKKNFWCDVGASVHEDASVAGEVGWLLLCCGRKSRMLVLSQLNIVNLDRAWWYCEE